MWTARRPGGADNSSLSPTTLANKRLYSVFSLQLFSFFGPLLFLLLGQPVVDFFSQTVVLAPTFLLLLLGAAAALLPGGIGI